MGHGARTAAAALALVNGLSTPAAAAGAAGRLGANSSDLSLAEAVQSCSLAQLLQQARAGAAVTDQQQQQQQAAGAQVMTMQSFMPLLADLADVQHLRYAVMSHHAQLMCHVDKVVLSLRHLMG
jgi:hypothetical protein